MATDVALFSVACTSPGCTFHCSAISVVACRANVQDHLDFAHPGRLATLAPDNTIYIVPVVVRGA